MHGMRGVSPSGGRALAEFLEQRSALPKTKRMHGNFTYQQGYLAAGSNMPLTTLTIQSWRGVKKTEPNPQARFLRPYSHQQYFS